MWALREAGEAARGGTAYVTLEPCNHFGRTPPCSQALLDSGVLRVVTGMVDPNPLVAGKGLQKLRDGGVEVVVGVEEEKCANLNAPFVHRMRHKIPYGVLRVTSSSGSPPPLWEGEDAIVVNGENGVRVMESMAPMLPPTVKRVVICASIEEDLASVSDNPAWTGGYVGGGGAFIICGPLYTKCGVTCKELQERGVTLLQPHSKALPPSSVVLAPPQGILPDVSAVMNVLYDMGVMAMQWATSSDVTLNAFKQGYVQLVLVPKNEEEKGLERAGWGWLLPHLQTHHDAITSSQVAQLEGSSDIEDQEEITRAIHIHQPQGD